LLRLPADLDDEDDPAGEELLAAAASFECRARDYLANVRFERRRVRSQFDDFGDRVILNNLIRSARHGDIPDERSISQQLLTRQIAATRLPVRQGFQPAAAFLELGPRMRSITSFAIQSFSHGSGSMCA